MNWLNKFFYKNNDTEEVLNEEVQNFPHLALIHGANASSLTFNFLLERLPKLSYTLLEYSSHNSFYNNLTTMKSTLDENTPYFVIGHSLGGLYGLHLTQHMNIIGGISISTPFKGSATAEWARFLVPKYQLFKDIGRKSPPIVAAGEIYPNVPWTQIVTTLGNVPWHEGPNDGVVTVASMEHMSDRMEVIKVSANHYEIMCSNEMVDIVRSKLVL